jgi:hypothetical protein
MENGLTPDGVGGNATEGLEIQTGTRHRDSERGMATAELLGNAALGIAALVAIWAVLQAVGLDVMDWIRGQLQV